MPRVLVVDHHDSFTYNLVQLLAAEGARVRVVACDAIDVPGIAADAPDGVLLSPGPCSPDEAGVSVACVRELAGTIPMLGVCLGHQCIAQALGARVVRAERQLHGRTSPILHDARGVFRGLPQRFEATRYHSLVVDPRSVPPCLEVSAWTAEGEIMGLRHRTLAVDGVQFHPESVLTRAGPPLVRNWLRALAHPFLGNASQVTP